MSPDDVRHGTLNGYKNLRCRCDPCSQAESRYEKQRKWLVHQGLTPTVPAIGFQRRVRALMAIGWTQLSIAQGLGIAGGNLALKLRSNTTVYRATHLAMCDLYEDRCMFPQRGPVNDRTARIAAKRGWAPPLGWDDIDDPDEQPNLGGIDNQADPVVVARIIGRDMTLARSATPAERRAVVAGWPGSLAELERLTGWRADRYIERPGAVA